MHSWKSHRQHSKQTSGPGFVTLPPRSKAGSKVPACPSRQPGSLRSSKFPSFKQIPEKHGLFPVPSWRLEPAPGSSASSYPPAPGRCSRSILRALAVAGKIPARQGTWMHGKKDNSWFIGLWPCSSLLGGLERAALSPQGWVTHEMPHRGVVLW